MATPKDGPGPGLGQRLRKVRTSQSISVRELARRAGCSASLISQVERGHSAPSAGILYSLANELRVSLDYLFGFGPNGGGSDDRGGGPGATLPAILPPSTFSASSEEGSRDVPGPRSPVVASTGGRLATTGAIVQRADSRRAIDLSSGVRWERLTCQEDAQVDFLEVVYAPHGRSTDSNRPVRHNGREYLLVLSGGLSADIGFETYELQAGDSLAFDPTTPHLYRNTSDGEVRCVSFVVHD
ncbi:MAG: PuuR-like transcription factor [Pseudonocardiales bacterium]|jgi:transcriptional regulator with XRE-family HTH domain/mannose-6-phosphate isomerase-like protein (cupin superfamily)|nr:PuuR-like transcription factor [Pseudonocardiales bacterium]